MGEKKKSNLTKDPGITGAWGLPIDRGIQMGHVDKKTWEQRLEGVNYVVD